MKKTTFDTNFIANSQLSLTTEQPKKLVWQTPRLELIGPIKCTGNRPPGGRGDGFNRHDS